ncbi:GTP cyclohydrolase II [Labilithrix luteola]|uniref:GTP cyclohydrolase II n=1 Tax=Labilithrix luteola TaxID=1391654 RepID=A0A0K1PK87_9BACT|nr:NADAR family protein [Labilithrix luteola]AKU93524.1 GTP cyclohydrolase II [Labilithrix luteola]
MWTRQSLTTHLVKGHRVDFLFFWGHTPKSPGRVDASCLSQWFPAPFVIDGVRYATAEHFMMAEKARLFGDDDALSNILAAKSPPEAKALGRTVRNYDDDAWSAARVDAVVRGNLAKFGQDEALGAFLRSTGRRILVEASPHDRIWGIGLGGSNPAAQQPSQWRGQNLLGFALTEVRARLFGGQKDHSATPLR